MPLNTRRTKTALLLPLLGLAVIAALASCKPSTAIVGGKANPGAYVRGVSLSPGPSEIALVFRTSLRLAGRSEACDYPNLVKSFPVVMSGTKPDYEKIVSLAPELVIYDGDLFSPQDLEKFKELNIATYGFEARTLRGFEEELYRFASMTQAELRISEYVDQIEGSASRARGAAVPDWKPKVAVMLSGGGSEHWVAGTDSFLADVVRTCGAEPIGPKAPKFAAMNAEAFIAANPDVIIVAGDPNEVAHDARLSSVNAIKKGNISGILESILLRKGSRVPKMIDNVSAIIAGAKR